MLIGRFKVSDPLKFTMGILFTLILAIGTYGFARVNNIEARILKISDTYAKKEDLSLIYARIGNIDLNVRELRKEMRSMLEDLRKELRYDRQRRANLDK